MWKSPLLIWECNVEDDKYEIDKFYNLLSEEDLNYEKIGKQISLLSNKKIFNNYLKDKLDEIDYNIFINKVSIIKILSEEKRTKVTWKIWNRKQSYNVSEVILKNCNFIREILENVIKKTD